MRRYQPTIKGVIPLDLISILNSADRMKASFSIHKHLGGWCTDEVQVIGKSGIARTTDGLGLQLSSMTTAEMTKVRPALEPFAGRGCARIKKVRESFHGRSGARQERAQGVCDGFDPQSIFITGKMARGRARHWHGEGEQAGSHTVTGSGRSVSLTEQTEEAWKLSGLGRPSFVRRFRSQSEVRHMYMVPMGSTVPTSEWICPIKVGEMQDHDIGHGNGGLLGNLCVLDD
ncbi:hypothetical protein LX32DRAFT_656848 [Colletotrichum zoysiae]|uniref:Uncharacterized protein n=1 Tax=Colletotrichum zoysiae TaxID=1216348 RepID=A0AAD9LVG7_9PEZI|nr:hypothetical protein LX32DRAFT_656848 [Colletotrichum zoysiae]